MSVISTVRRRLTQETQEFKISLGFVAKKKRKKEGRKRKGNIIIKNKKKSECLLFFPVFFHPASLLSRKAPHRVKQKEERVKVDVESSSGGLWKRGHQNQCAVFTTLLQI